MAKPTPRQIQIAIGQEAPIFTESVNDSLPTVGDIRVKDGFPTTLFVSSGTKQETKKSMRKSNQSLWGWILSCMKSFGDC